ncbi:hypothetical protein ACLB9X_08615 [Streptomyces sp. 5K101]|uniref:hypothetical protein n=1 Tax=Streptomyces sp. 5K101 TaxID=3390037 RepID=UPI003976E662
MPELKAASKAAVDGSIPVNLRTNANRGGVLEHQSGRARVVRVLRSRSHRRHSPFHGGSSPVTVATSPEGRKSFIQGSFFFFSWLDKELGASRGAAGEDRLDDPLAEPPLERRRHDLDEPDEAAAEDQRIGRRYVDGHRGATGPATPPGRRSPRVGFAAPSRIRRRRR